MPLKIVMDNITKIKCDAIVNYYVGHFGNDSNISKVIHERGGDNLIEECKKARKCTVGECVMTDAFNIASNYIIHTVVPASENDLEHLLAKCYKSSFLLCVKEELHSVAYPLLAAEKTGIALEKAIKIALNRIVANLRWTNDEVVVYLVLQDVNTMALAFTIAKEVVPSEYLTTDVEAFEPIKTPNIKMSGSADFSKASRYFVEKIKRVSSAEYTFTDDDYQKSDRQIYKAYRAYTVGDIDFATYQNEWITFLNKFGVIPAKDTITQIDSRLILDVPLNIDKLPNEHYTFFKSQLFIKIYQALNFVFEDTPKSQTPFYASEFALVYNDRQNGTVRRQPITFVDLQKDGWEFNDYLEYCQLCRRIYTLVTAFSAPDVHVYAEYKTSKLHDKIVNAVLNLKRFLYLKGVCGRHSYEYIPFELQKLLVEYGVYAYYRYPIETQDGNKMFVSRTFDNFRMSIERHLFASDPSDNYCLMNYVDGCVEKTFDQWTDLELFVSQKDCALTNNEINSLLNKLKSGYEKHSTTLEKIEATINNVALLNSDKDLTFQLESYEYNSDILLNIEELIKLVEKLKAERIPQWSEKDTLYIHKGTIKCQRNNHKIISATAVLIGRNESKIELNVNYCTECNLFFLNYESYKLYRNRYGMLLGNLRLEAEGMTLFGDTYLAEASPLKLCGYSVNQQDGYSKSERQYIISKIIDNEIMQKTDVIKYLEYFINMNGKKTGNEIALHKWMEDLEFVLKYHSEHQNKYDIRNIKRY